MTPELEALLATHADVLKPLLGPLWPVHPIEVKQYRPLTKYTLGPLEGEWVHLHHVTEPDQGAPHCHPCRMFSTRIKGSYWERVYKDGQSMDVLRTEGSSHVIEPDTVHLLTSLPDGEVWTVVREWHHYPELLEAA
jgi:hypothetical protein